MKRKRYGHFLRSKHTPNNIKLVRKLNKSSLNWNLDESTHFSYDPGNGQKTEGWAFNFHFIYEGVTYGANESVTDMLKYKDYELFQHGRHVEICGIEKPKK